MTTQVISVDVGIKNLAYCIVEASIEKTYIKYIEKVDLECKKNDYQKIIDKTLLLLDDILFNKLITEKDHKIIVLIESQMTSIMKCIQTTINVFFKMQTKYQSLNIETHVVSPRHKLNLMVKYKNEYVIKAVNQSTQYKQNKIDSIQFANWLLENKYNNINEEVVNYFVNQNKQDDLCDCILMCVYFIEEKMPWLKK